MNKDDALNTLAKVFHSGEEFEGDDGMEMAVDLALWNEGCEAVEMLIGGEEDETAKAIAIAYGYLCQVENVIAEESVYKARDVLHDVMTPEERWNAINRVRELMGHNQCLDDKPTRP